MVAMIDWFLLRVLSRRVSNILTTVFCLDAVRKTIVPGMPRRKSSIPTKGVKSRAPTSLKDSRTMHQDQHGWQRSWRDNVLVERLWKSVKYEEEVYPKAYDSMSATKSSLRTYSSFYNTRRPHQSLDSKTPDAIYFGGLTQGRIAA